MTISLIARASSWDTAPAGGPPSRAGTCRSAYDCLVTVVTPDINSAGVVFVDPVPFVNYASCINAVDDTDAGTSCAIAPHQAYECTAYACMPFCPAITDEASQAALTTCMNQAATGSCAGYNAPAAACAAAEMGAGDTAVATCFAGQNPQEHYLGAARYFCESD
jgi:hypothetical protein